MEFIEHYNLVFSIELYFLFQWHHHKESMVSNIFFQLNDHLKYHISLHLHFANDDIISVGG